MAIPDPETGAWFDRAFGADYEKLYAHRSDENARADVARITRVTDLAQRRIVDLACGNGRHMQAIAEQTRAQQIVGLDRSPHLIAAARRRLPQALLVRADLRALPIADSSFDLALNLFTSFGYFADDDEHLHALCEMRRVLAAGGQLYIDHIDSESLTRDLIAHSHESAGGIMTEVRRWIEGGRVHKHIRSQDGRIDLTERVRIWPQMEFRLLLETAGFVVLELSMGDGRMRVLARRQEK